MHLSRGIMYTNINLSEVMGVRSHNCLLTSNSRVWTSVCALDMFCTQWSLTLLQNTKPCWFSCMAKTHRPQLTQHCPAASQGWCIATAPPTVGRTRSSPTRTRVTPSTTRYSSSERSAAAQARAETLVQADLRDISLPNAACSLTHPVHLM